MDQMDSFIDILAAKTLYTQRLQALGSLPGHVPVGNVKEPLPNLVHDGLFPKYVPVQRTNTETVSSGHCTGLQTTSSVYHSDLQPSSSNHEKDLQTVSSVYHSDLQPSSSNHQKDLQTTSSDHRSNLQPSFPAHNRDLQTVSSAYYSELQPISFAHRSDLQTSSAHNRDLQIVSSSHGSDLQALSSYNTNLQPSSSRCTDLVHVCQVQPPTGNAGSRLPLYFSNVSQHDQTVNARKPLCWVQSNTVYSQSQHNETSAYSKGQLADSRGVSIQTSAYSKGQVGDSRGVSIQTSAYSKGHVGEAHGINNETGSSQFVLDLTRSDRGVSSNECSADLGSSDVNCISKYSESLQHPSVLIRPNLHLSNNVSSHLVAQTQSDINVSQKSGSHYRVANKTICDGHIASSISTPHSREDNVSKHTASSYMVSNLIQSDGRTSKDANTSHPQTSVNTRNSYSQVSVDERTSNPKTSVDIRTSHHSSKDARISYPMSGLINTNNEHLSRQTVASHFDELVSSDNRKYPNGNVCFNSVADISKNTSHTSVPIQEKDAIISKPIQKTRFGTLIEPDLSHLSVSNMLSSENVPQEKHGSKKAASTPINTRKNYPQPKHGKIFEDSPSERPSVYKPRALISFPTILTKGKMVPPNVTKNVVERPAHLQGSLSHIIGIDPRMSMRQIIQNTAIGQQQKRVSNPEFSLSSTGTESCPPGAVLLRPSQIPDPLYHSSVSQFEKPSQTKTLKCHPLAALGVQVPQSSLARCLPDKESTGGPCVSRVISADSMRPAVAIALHEPDLLLHRGLPNRGSFSESHLTGLLNVRPPETLAIHDLQSLHRGLSQKESENGSLLSRLVNTESARPPSILATHEPHLLLPLPHMDSSVPLLTRMTPRSYENEQILMSPPYRPFSVSSFMSFDPHSEQTPQVTYNDLQMSIFGERLDPFLEQFFSDHSSDNTKVHSVMTSGHRTNTKFVTNDVSGINKSSDHSTGLVNSDVHTVHNMLNLSSSRVRPVNKEMWTSTLNNIQNDEASDVERPDTCTVAMTSDQSSFPISSHSKSVSTFGGIELKQVDSHVNEISKTVNINQDAMAICNDGVNAVDHNCCSNVSAANNENVNCRLPANDNLDIHMTTLNNEMSVSVPSENHIASLKSGQSAKEAPEIKSCLEAEDSVKHQKHISLDSVMSSDCDKSVYKCSHCPKGFKNISYLNDHEMSHSSKKLYKCPECGRCYKDSSSLNRHARVHLGKRNHKCAVCGKAFLDSYALESHVRVHTKEKSHLCSTCGKSFSHASELQVHGCSHTGVRPYVCGKCGKGFSKSSKLQVHNRSHTGEKPFSCQYCSKAFAVSSNLKVHMRTHTGPVSYRCESCKQVFSEKEEYNNHMKTHSDFISYNCHLCPKKFVELSRLEEHESVHTGGTCVQCLVCKKSFKKVHKLIFHQAMMHQEKETFSCDVCQRDFCTSSDLSHHMKTHSQKSSSTTDTVSNITSNPLRMQESKGQHQCEICQKTFVRCVDLQEHLNTHTGQKPNKCGFCGQGFCSRGGLRKHVRNLHKENSSSVGNKISSRKNVCELCGKTFKQLCHLKVHRRIHFGEKPYLCEFCGKRFRDSGIRNRHVRIHTGDKPHKCKVCTKSFIDSGSLQKHLAVHTKPKNHVCKTCGKGFNFQGDLQVHTRSHSGDKPFKCESCGKCFAKSSKLVIHRRTHSGEKPYKCTICNRAFSVSSNLRAHTKTHATLTTYSCSTCSRIFYCSDKLDQHVREAHSSISMIPCPECDKSFAEEYRLKEHLFTHNKIKQFQCSQCDKSFIRHHNLQLHQHFHSSARTHHCEKCSSSFHKFSDLQKHMHSHDNTTMPRCEECDIKFPTSKDLHQHFCSVHAEERQFNCHHCSKGFRRKAEFNVHLRTHTGLRPFKCNICNKGFCGKSGLRKHTVMNHSK